MDGVGVLDEIKALSAQLGLGFGLSLAKKIQSLRYVGAFGCDRC